VCFAHRDGDDASARLLKAVNVTGRAYLTHTRLAESTKPTVGRPAACDSGLIDRYAIRVSIGQTRTERRHVEALWSLIDSLAP